MSNFLLITLIALVMIAMIVGMFICALILHHFLEVNCLLNNCVYVVMKR